MQLMHVVAHTRGGWADVAKWESAQWLWSHMRAVFPDVVANLLMLDHTHTLAPTDQDRLNTFRRVLQHHGRRFGTRWDLAPPTPCHSRAIARRTARYDFDNPVFAGLVDDPLVWPFSTFRDALGLTADPWGAPATIRRVLGYTPAQLHGYVTAVAECSPNARIPLRRIGRGDALVANLTAMAAACASALRCRPQDLRRKGHPIRPTFVGLALQIGSPNLDALASACDVSARGLRRLRHRADRKAVAIAWRCLADPRLHVWNTPTRRYRDDAGRGASRLA